MGKISVIARAAVVATVALPLLLAPVSTASASTCNTRKISNSFGHADVIRCGTYVTGTVYDDKADGKCVYYWVYFNMPGGYQQVQFSDNACPKGSSSGFYLDGGSGSWNSTDGISTY